MKDPTNIEAREPSNLPAEIFGEICQYLPLSEIDQARHVSSSWFMQLSKLNRLLITRWYQQDVPRPASLDLSQAKKERIMAFERGVPFSETVIRGHFEHTTYANDVLTWIDSERSSTIGNYRQLRSGAEGTITPINRIELVAIAGSHSMIVAADRSSLCYVLELSPEQVKIVKHIKHIPHKLSRVDCLLVSKETFVVIDLSLAGEATITTFTLVPGKTETFTILSRTQQAKFMLDHSGQYIVQFQHVRIDQGGADNVHCERYDLEGNLKSEDSKYCPFGPLPSKVSSRGMVIQTRYSTIWTFLRQSEDSRDNDTSWVLHRICYDDCTAKLKLQCQVIRGLRTTSDGIANIFHWKDVVYCRGYAAYSPSYQLNTQVGLSIINLKTSLCHEVEPDMTSFIKGISKDHYHGDTYLQGDETFLVETWKKRISVLSFHRDISLGDQDKNKSYELRNWLVEKA